MFKDIFYKQCGQVKFMICCTKIYELFTQIILKDKTQKQLLISKFPVKHFKHTINSFDFRHL